MVKSLRECKDTIKDKRVLLRLDLNVPIVGGKVHEDFRIKKSLITLNFLLEAGAKVIIVSHIEGEEPTLRPVFDYLQKQYQITFVEDYIEKDISPILDSMKNGGIVMFENLRLYDGERKNDPVFAKKLSGFADIYVNEAFSVSHRCHSSIVGVPKLMPGFIGFLFEDEIKNLSRLFNPPKPFLFVLGGAKFETKIPLINKFIDSADFIFVGGALANNFYQEQGLNIGKSVVSPGNFNLDAMLKSGKVILPDNVVVKDGNKISSKIPQEIDDNDVIVDSGGKGISKLKELIAKSKFILWNGPLGNYEMGFSKGTLELATAIAESGVDSIVGGADTLAAISSLGLEGKFGFISTGGGAMLDFLANGTLPGIQALKGSEK